jgi:hypothetical protein
MVFSMALPMAAGSISLDNARIHIDFEGGLGAQRTPARELT